MLSSAHGKFEVQNKVMELSMIIINHCVIIIINIINAHYVAVIVAATTSCSEIRLCNILSNVTHSTSHRQSGAPMMSGLRTAPDLCKNVSFAVLFRRNGTSYTTSPQSDTSIYTYSSI